MKFATVTVPVRLDVRYGTTAVDGTFRESLASTVERVIGHGVLRALTLVAVFGAGLTVGLLA